MSHSSHLVFLVLFISSLEFAWSYCRRKKTKRKKKFLSRLNEILEPYFFFERHQKYSEISI